MSQENKQDQTIHRDRDERSQAESVRAPMNVRLNHQKRELYVSMTRAVAGVSVASFCGMLIGIMALSRNVTNTGPQAAKASSYQMPAVRPVKIKAPKLTSANGGKLTPTHAAADAAPVVAPPTTQPKLERSIITENPKPLVANPTTAPSVVAKVSSRNEPRSVGRVYFIFGSFPDAMDAKSVVDKLKKKGIPCTVERSLPDWTYEGWFSVVSVKGYPTTKDQAYQKEIKTLEDKDLEPCPYKWRRAQHGA